MSRLFRFVGTLWSIVGITLLCLIILNALLVWLLPEPDGPARVERDAQAPDIAVSDAFADAPWNADYWVEHEQARATAWRSYVYWRRQPFAGSQIRVDEHGFRHTWQNPEAGDDAPEVWVFGGSVVWGTGVPDEWTLPSQLAKLYARLRPGQPVRVYNFGESGYVSGQSRAALAQALACRGRRPALAIFVDGANDVFAAFQSDVAGEPQNEQRRRIEFNSSQRAGNLLAAWVARIDGLERLRAWLAPPVAEASSVAELAEQVVQRYLEHVRQIGDLAAGAGIRTHFVWQPHLFSKVSQSADEQRIVAGSYRRHRALQLASDTALATRVRAGISPVLDLSGLYRDVPEALFGDFVHINAA
ncbi:MAG: SGNH/GDSL hydrolase family protein, partial [Xanthomonadales bacterium]|nr:SGNH/GDSL hydrolase family protein [Xanthomonadales bacterium]